MAWHARLLFSKRYPGSCVSFFTIALLLNSNETLCGRQHEITTIQLEDT